MIIFPRYVVKTLLNTRIKNIYNSMVKYIFMKWKQEGVKRQQVEGKVMFETSKD